MTTKTKEVPLNLEPRSRRFAANSRPAFGIEKWLLRRLLKAMRDPPLTLRLWSGEQIHGSSQPSEVTLHIKEPQALWGILANPDLYFGDAYSDGTIEVDGDLLRMIELATLHRPQLVGETGPLGLSIRLLAPTPRTNNLKASRHNIHHHYDLGNDFYRLWLDHQYMQYTCAYFPDPAMILEDAQVAKMEHVCRKLQLKPGDTVVEAGCGWGGLAHYMAERYGVTVRAYNISHEQVSFAIEKAKLSGLQGKVEYIEEDYRNITGEYDVFVSVGMLEHVGRRNYRALGGVIDRCLKSHGRGLIHSIGRNAPRLMNRWIEKRIFPGAYPPALSEMMSIFEPYDLSILDIENLRLHYAKTLEHWLQRFEEHRVGISEEFDERFVRAWRLYLTGSICAFKLGDLQLFQLLFSRGDDNRLPWSRKYIYGAD